MFKAENEDSAPLVDEVPTIEEHLEAIGMGRFNYIALFVLALFNIAYGMEILVSNICYRAMPRTAWGMTDQDRANLVSISYIGFIIGAMITGFYADTFGRKPLIILHSVLFIPFALWSALATNLFIVYVTRATVGISVGIMLPVSVSLIAELAPPSQRGWMILAVPSIGFTLGQITVLLVGLIAMRSGDVECEDDCGWWRWVFAAGLFPDAVALVLFLLYVPESPRFLLLRGRVAEAEEVVRSIAVSNNAEARVRGAGRVRPLEPADGRASVWELFAPPLAGDMALISVVWVLFGFGHYGLNFVVPVVLETVYHFNAHWQFCLLLLYVGAELACLLLVMATVDLGTFGRLVFLLGLSIAAVPLCIAAAFALGGSPAAFIGIVMAGKATAASAYQLVFVYAAERLPTSHRGLGLGVGNGVSKAAAVATPVALMAVMRVAPPGAALLALAGAVAAGAAALAVGSTETLGKALTDYPDRNPAAVVAAAVTTKGPPTERTPLI